MPAKSRLMIPGVGCPDSPAARHPVQSTLAGKSFRCLYRPYALFRIFFRSPCMVFMDLWRQRRLTDVEYAFTVALVSMFFLLVLPMDAKRT